MRKYIYPDLEAKFTNTMGVTAAVPTTQINNQEGFQFPVIRMNLKHGAFVIAPQLADGSELLIGKQRHAPELDREGWNALLNGKQWCVDFLWQGSEEFPEIVQSAASNTPLDKIDPWPSTSCRSSTRGRRSIRVW